MTQFLLVLQCTSVISCHISYLIYHLFLFHGSVQDYKIHMDMEIVIFA